jgi:hypothetical protein
MRSHIAFVVAAMLACAGSAQAGRPLTTDDAGVLEARSCEAETYFAQLRAKGDAGTRASGWQTQLGCGGGHGVQASLSYARSRDDAQRDETAGLGGKLELLAGEPGRPALAATLGANALRVVGSGFQLKDHTAALVLTHAVAPGWTAHANLGVTRDRVARQTSSLWNLALERTLVDGFDVAGEAYGDDRGGRWLAGGVRWTPLPAFSVNASVGEGRGVRLLSVGAKLAF